MADHYVHDTRLTLATIEPMPLAAFGGAAARTVVNLLSDRGIELVAGCLVAPDAHGRVDLHRFGTLRPDRIVTLPRLAGNPIPGLPTDHEGFVPVDAHARVVGLGDVYAVGDAAAFPIKQGGLAAQQADVAAASVAAGLGRPVTPEAFVPVMRGLLLTGVTSAYLRSDPVGADGEASQAAYRPLWWPPAKIAGRYLAPYLADQTDPLGPLELAEPHSATLGTAARDRSEARRLALEFADADAQWGDHESALRWLQTIEWLDGALSDELAARREAWRREAAVR